MLIDYWSLPSILYSGWVKGASKENCISGFRDTGIWPVDMNWTEEKSEDLAPSMLFHKAANSNINENGTDTEHDWEEAEFISPKNHSVSTIVCSSIIAVNAKGIRIDSTVPEIEITPRPPGFARALFHFPPYSSSYY
jgi:hypothetical protein